MRNRMGEGRDREVNLKRKRERYTERSLPFTGSFLK